MNAITPIPWKDHMAPMAAPRYFLNHRVTPETDSIEKMVAATPSMTPKKRQNCQRLVVIPTALTPFGAPYTSDTGGD